MSWAVKISPGGVLWIEVIHPLIHSFILHSRVQLFLHSLARWFGWPVGNVKIGVNEWVLGTAIMELESLGGKTDQNKAKK